MGMGTPIRQTPMGSSQFITQYLSAFNHHAGSTSERSMAAENECVCSVLRVIGYVG